MFDVEKQIARQGPVGRQAQGVGQMIPLRVYWKARYPHRASLDCCPRGVFVHWGSLAVDWGKCGSSTSL